MKYFIFYKEMRIGILEINENTGLYKYTKEEDAAEKIKDIVSLPVEMTENTDWVDPIPVFKNKIDNAKRFGRDDNIGSFIDPFRMVKAD